MQRYDYGYVRPPGFPRGNDPLSDKIITGSLAQNRAVSIILSQVPERPSTDRSLTIRYDPKDASQAAYDVRTNEILMRDETLFLTEESLRAVISHEKTHALFSELSADEQGRIVNTFMKHPGELAAFYETLRQYYEHEYFSLDRSITRIAGALGAGKQRKILKAELNNNGTLEEVDVTCVINELLAFSNQRTQAHDALGENRFMQTITDLARTMVGLLDEDTRTLLESKGFFSIDPTALLEQLNKDELFIKERQIVQSAMVVDYKFSNQLEIRTSGIETQSVTRRDSFFNGIGNLSG